MARPSSSLLVALASTLLVVMAIAVPALTVDVADPATIRLYYGFGLGGLWAVGVIAAVLAIVFLAAVTERTDQVLAASVGLGGGLVMLLVAAIWALSVEPEVIDAFAQDEWMTYHRWIVLGLSLIPGAASLWLARERDLV